MSQPMISVSHVTMDFRMDKNRTTNLKEYVVNLLTGKSPYEPPYQFVPARQLNPALSHGMEYVLGKCVQPEPADRYQNTEQLLDDLNHIYKFDKAWKKYKAVKRTRALVLVLMLAASAALIAVAGIGVAKISLLGWEAFSQSGQVLQLFRWKELLLAAVIFGAIKCWKKLHPVVWIALSAAAGVLLNLGGF